MSASNPFASLFNEAIKDPKTSLSELLEEIFGFTIDPDHVSKDKLYLEEVRKVHDKAVLDMSLMHYALFERLFMCNDQSILQKSNSNSHSYENKVINYLFLCFKKLKDLENQMKLEDANEIENEIVQNVATAFQPDIYSGQNIPDQIVELLLENESHSVPFFNEAIRRVLLEDNGSRLN